MNAKIRDVMATTSPRHLVYRSGEGRLSWADDDAILREALADDEGMLWLDLTIRSDADAALLRDVFSFHELTIEDCISARVDPARIDDYQDYLFIIVQALSEYDSERELEPVEVDFYLGRNYVVSCHQEPILAIDEFRERCRRDERLLQQSPDWVLHGLIDAIVDEYLPIVDAVDDTIDKLEEQILERPDTHLMRQIMLAKRNALRIRRATIPQREIMNRLSRGEFARFISDEEAIYFRDVYDHLTRIDYLIEAVRDLADGALNTYLSVISNRLNEIMKVLTAAAAIFLPLTLISGIYGMNFEHNQFPGFDESWGFAAAVGSMVALAVGLLVFSRWRGWI
jgi:magnesium transporter